MSEDVRKTDRAKFTFTFFGITLVFEPRDLYDWIPIVLILIVFGFFSFLLLDREETRKKVAGWIYTPPAVVQPQAPPSAVDGATRSEPPSRPGPEQKPADIAVEQKLRADPPQTVSRDAKSPSEITTIEIPGENRSSVQDPSSAPPPLQQQTPPVQQQTPPLQQQKLYRVRMTAPNLNGLIKVLPMHSRPGADKKTIKRIRPGAEGLVATGRVDEVYDGGLWDKIAGNPPVPWIEVTFEGVTGWVSAPYLEEIAAASK